MVRGLTAAALLGGFFVAASPVQGQGLCSRHADLAEHLEKKYGETVSATGFDGAGNLVEIFSSDKGTWTMAVSVPGGLTCVISAGRDWRDVPRRAPEVKS